MKNTLIIIFLLFITEFGLANTVYGQVGEIPPWIDPNWVDPNLYPDTPDVPGEDIPEVGTDGDFSLNDLEFTAQEFILNIQKLGFIKATLKMIDESNIDLLASYHMIRDIQEGTFSLHEEFHETVLLRVKDEVKNHSKVIQTGLVLNDIRKEAQDARALIVDIDVFDAAEKAFWTESYSNILHDAANITVELAEIVLDGKLKMNDAERIELVYVLYDSSVALLNGLRKFNSQMRYTANLRYQHTDDYQQVSTLFTISGNE